MTVVPINGYRHLPEVQEAHRMTSWARCPLHKELVGFDNQGRLVGRCGGCAGEASRALRILAIKSMNP